MLQWKDFQYRKSGQRIQHVAAAVRIVHHVAEKRRRLGGTIELAPLERDLLLPNLQVRAGIVRVEKLQAVRLDLEGNALHLSLRGL